MEKQKVISLLMAMIETLLYSGMLFGWASINPVLIKEGFFSDRCSENIKANGSTRDTCYNGNKCYEEEEASRLCKRQINMFDFVFTIATTLALVMSLFTGYIYDKMGGWFTRTYCLVILSFGLFMCALSTSSSSNLLFCSFSLVAYSGSGLYTVNVQVANFFPKYRSFICALISGLYDSSALVFLVFYTVYNHGVSYKTIFISHAILCIAFHAYTFLLTPKYPPEVPLPEDYVFGYRELACFGGNKKTGRPKVQSISSTDSEEISFKQCLKLPYTWTNILHTCILQFCMANFIGNFNLWISSTFKNEDAINIDQYTTLFGAVQCGGFLFAPLSGLLMDYLRSRFRRLLPPKLAALKAASYSILIATVLTILMLVFSLVPMFQLQIITFVMQAMARAFICGTLCAFLIIAYPTTHFGKMYGINMSILGVVYLLQYPLDMLITDKLNNSFTIVNLVLLVLSLIATCHPLYILYFVSKQSQLKDDKIGLVQLE